MTITIPEFVEGIHFRRMRVSESDGKYRFETLRKISVPINGFPVSPVAFFSNGSEWFRITPYELAVPKGYAWNGSSPKQGYCILGKDIWLGTPDFRETILASLFHDALFQFSATKHFPFSLEQSNDIFFLLCGKFRLANAYSGALKDWSKNYFNRPPLPGEYSALL